MGLDGYKVLGMGDVIRDEKLNKHLHILHTCEALFTGTVSDIQ